MRRLPLCLFSGLNCTKPDGSWCKVWCCLILWLLDRQRGFLDGLHAGMLACGAR